MDTHERVLHFIALIKGHKSYNGHDAHEILEQVYSRGTCYMFAKALQFVFPEAEIYTTHCLGVHVYAKIDGKFYDIKGHLTNESEINALRPLTENEEKSARTWCYSHKLEHCNGIEDSSDNRIYELEELEYDPKRNAWKLPEQPAEIEDEEEIDFYDDEEDEIAS